jgi:hypothetical protein
VTRIQARNQIVIGERKEGSPQENGILASRGKPKLSIGLPSNLRMTR